MKTLTDTWRLSDTYSRELSISPGTELPAPGEDLGARRCVRRGVRRVLELVREEAALIGDTKG